MLSLGDRRRKALQHSTDEGGVVVSGAGKPEYFLAVDMAKEEFRAINLNSLRKAKVNGKLYEFQ